MASHPCRRARARADAWYRRLSWRRSSRGWTSGYLRQVEPSFLFLGLGDTDEYAHRNDYRGYLRALGHADHVVG